MAKKESTIESLIEYKKEQLRNILENGCGEDCWPDWDKHCIACTEEAFVLTYELYGYGELLV